MGITVLYIEPVMQQLLPDSSSGKPEINYVRNLNILTDFFGGLITSSAQRSLGSRGGRTGMARGRFCHRPQTRDACRRLINPFFVAIPSHRPDGSVRFGSVGSAPRKPSNFPVPENVRSAGTRNRQSEGNDTSAGKCQDSSSLPTLFVVCSSSATPSQKKNEKKEEVSRTEICRTTTTRLGILARKQ